MTCDSVDLPEPFGPMIACTSPGFTVSDSPWRISLSSTRTFRSLTSSSDITTTFQTSAGALRPEIPGQLPADPCDCPEPNLSRILDKAPFALRRTNQLPLQTRTSPCKRSIRPRCSHP